MDIFINQHILIPIPNASEVVSDIIPCNPSLQIPTLVAFLTSNIFSSTLSFSSLPSQ